MHDILEAVERVEKITHNKTLAQFEGSWELRWLVQRAIEIISEASRAHQAGINYVQGLTGHHHVMTCALRCVIIFQS